MNDNRKVMFPNELINDMEFEGTIFPEDSSKIGVANLSHRDGSTHVLRVYQLLYNEDAEAYEPIQELAAFKFNERNELTDFLNHLPYLNGLEMLILLNPLTTDVNMLN